MLNSVSGFLTFSYVCGVICKLQKGYADSSEFYFNRYVHMPAKFKFNVLNFKYPAFFDYLPYKYNDTFTD